MLTIADVANNLGVALLASSDAGDTYQEIGYPPTSVATLALRTGAVVVVYDETADWVDVCPLVLHELMHAACGMPGMGDEGPLMGLQMSVIDQLRDQEQVACIVDFEGYCPPEGSNEDADTFYVYDYSKWRQTSSAAQCLKEAVAAGLVEQDGYVAWKKLRNTVEAWSRDIL